MNSASESVFSPIRRLKEICDREILNKGVTGQEKRLHNELMSIRGLNEVEYFLDLYDKQARFAENENNLLVVYLLDLAASVDLENEPAFDMSDFPDIDSDLLPQVREYLRKEYVPRQFGRDNVCNIASYGTFGIKSAILDMARVFNLPHDQVNRMTKKLSDKDEDGDKLTWDAAMELYDDLREFCELHYEMADAAKRLVGRTKSRGQHASGLIISDRPIKDLVPLVAGKGEQPASAWVEGLHGTDLSAVGLVKFDFLVLDGNLKVAQACQFAGERKLQKSGRLIEYTSENIEKYGGMPGIIVKNAETMVRENLGIEAISSIDGRDSWTDLSYLNDEKSLSVANKSELRMIFQFDSDGIRKLVREGGVSRFEDLVAYTALYRPGPMKNGLHEAYCRRKSGEELFDIHPLLEPALGSTYGLIVYQEQCMRLLNLIGDIPLKDCEIVRKAISKKKAQVIQKYESLFKENGKKKLGWNNTQISELWAQFLAMSGYAFNLSHAVAYTYVSARMLYMKAHYPAEFTASVLSAMKTAKPDDFQKMALYRADAERMGVRVRGLDLNKSADHFRIVDDSIYWGFEKIRGIGEEAAKRIADNQPYRSFDEFLGRYGKESTVIQPLVALKQFPEADRPRLYRYYETVKKFEKNVGDRDKRFAKSHEKMKAELAALPSDIPEKKREMMVRKIERSVNSYMEKSGEAPPSIDDLGGVKLKLNEDVVKIMEDETMESAEQEYYGFRWSSPLTRCPDLGGQVFSRFEAEGLAVAPVEVVVLKLVERQTKAGNPMYKLHVEDIEGMKAWVTVWGNEYDRFGRFLQEGLCCRLILSEPSGGWDSYNLRQVRRNFPEHMDDRVQPLRLTKCPTRAA